MPNERTGGATRSWEPDPAEIERLTKVLQDALDTLELARDGGIVASQEDVDEAGAKGKTVVIAEDAAWAAHNGLEAYRALVALGAASPNPDAEKYFVEADKALWKYADMPLENVYPEMLILDWYGLKALSALAGVVSGFLAGMAARATVKIGLKAVLPRVAGVVVGGARLVGGLGTITGVPAIVRPFGVTIPGIGWLAALPMTGLAALQSAASKKPFAEEFTAHLVALFGPGGEGVRAPESSSKDILRRMHLSSGNAAVDFLPELVVDLVIMALVGGASQAGKRLAPRIEARMAKLPANLQGDLRALAGRLSLGVKMSLGEIQEEFPLGMTIRKTGMSPGAWRSVTDAVRELGGIKSTSDLKGEYRESIPLYLKNNKGMALDELADIIWTQRPDLLADRTAVALLDGLAKDARNPGRNISAEQANAASELAREQLYEDAVFPSGQRLNVGDKLTTPEGEQLVVTAKDAKNITFKDGEPFSVPVDTKIPIEPGTLKRAAGLPPPKPPRFPLGKPLPTTTLPKVSDANAYAKAVVDDIMQQMAKGKAATGQDEMRVLFYATDQRLPDEVKLFARAAANQLGRMRQGLELLPQEKLEAVTGFPFSKYTQPKPPVTTTGRVERVVEGVKGATPPAAVKPPSPTTPILKQIYRTFQQPAEVQRRGKISDYEARDLAARLGVTAEDLARILPGTAANVEKMFGTMDVVKRDTSSLINYVQNESLSAEAKRLEVIRHAKSVMALLGEAAEAGRALRVLRYQDPLVRVIKDLTDDVRDWKEPPDKVIDQIVSMIQGMDTSNPWDLLAVERLLRKSGQQKAWDKLYFVWLNFILSNPTTHVVNVTSNELTQLASVPESELAGLIGKLRGKGAQQLGEGLAQVVGMKRAIRDTLTNLNRIPSELQGVGKLDIKQGATLPLGAEKVVGLPTRLLSKEDLLAKAVVYYDEIYRLAWRQAMKEGLTGSRFTARVEELYAQPTSDMVKNGTTAALERTFNNELEGAMKKVMELRNAMPGARWILPFVRTPYNIAVYGLKRTPLGFTKLIGMAQEKAKLKAAGTWSQSREVAYQTEINKVLAAGIVGTMAELLVGWAATSGLITGSGPTDKNQREALIRQGWQPYSFKIGGKYYSYFRLEPLSTVLGLAADFAELFDSMTEGEKIKIATKIGGSLRNLLINKTFLNGVVDLSGFVSDPDRFGPHYLSGWGGSVIPGAVYNVRGTTDPQLREARTLLDAIRNKVPGWEKVLPARINRWGVPIVREENWLGRALSPVKWTTFKPDPVEDELKKIGYAPGTPGDTLGGRTLNLDEYEKLLKAGGPAVNAELTRLFATPEFQKMHVDEKKQQLRNVAAKFGLPSDKPTSRKMTPQEYEQFMRQAGTRDHAALVKLFAMKEYQDMSTQDKVSAVRKTLEDIENAVRDQMLGLPTKETVTHAKQFRPPTVGKPSPLNPPEHPIMPGYR